MREEIVVRGEHSLRYLKVFVEITLVRFFRFCDLVSPIVRWETVRDRLEHPPLILTSDCCFLQTLSQLVSTFSLARSLPLRGIPRFLAPFRR